MGKAPFGVAFFRPWIAEIEINDIQAVRREQIGQVLGIFHEKAKVVRAGIGGFHGLFQRQTKHIRHAFHGNEIKIRVRRGHAAGKIPFAAANLKAKRLFFRKERKGVVLQRFFIFDKQPGAGGNPLRPVLFLAGAHQTLKRKTTMSPSCMT